MASDPVNKPPHYQADTFECIDVIEHVLTPTEFAGYLKGNVLKYMYRHGYKGNPEQDLEKALWYLLRERGVENFTDSEEQWFSDSPTEHVGKRPTPEKRGCAQKCECAECDWLLRQSRCDV